MVKTYSETEKERVHNILDGGEIFPLFKIIDGKDVTERYAALETTKIYSMPASEVITEIENDLVFSNSLLVLSVNLFRDQSDRIDNLQYPDASQRVINRLLILAARFGKKLSNESYLINPVFTHKLIGDTLNLSRESVSREIASLQEKGLLNRSPHGIIISNVGLMAAELKYPFSSDIWGLVNVAQAT